MANAVQPRSLFIIGTQDVPRRVFCVRGSEHHVPRSGILEPFTARRQIHRAEFPLAQWIINARFEPALLLFVADLEPDFDELNPAVYDVSFHNRAALKKSLVLLVSAKAH